MEQANRQKFFASFFQKRSLAFLIQAVFRISLALGPTRASNLLGWFFRTLGPLLPVTRVADTNLRTSLPHLDAAARRRTIRAMWDNLGRNLGEFPHLAALQQNTPSGAGWLIEGEKTLLAQAARGGPAIFVSGHIGNWELLPPAVASYGMAFASVYRPAADARVNQLILDVRSAAIGRAMPLFPKGAKGARAAYAHLRNGGYLGMLVDQKLNDGIEARLFGLPAMTAPAAAMLAIRLGCPIIPGRTQRLGPARLRLVVDPPLPIPATGDRQADIAALTQSINDSLERWIRERPAEWLWLHRRFPKHVTARAGNPPTSDHVPASLDQQEMRT